jgi:hypothetical protein
MKGMTKENANGGIGILPMPRGGSPDTRGTSIALPRCPKMHRQDADATTHP